MSLADQREEVQRILHSPQFRRAPKLQRFLELVCDYHFQDRSAEINEFTIATQAFGKGRGFRTERRLPGARAGARNSQASARILPGRGKGKPPDSGHPDRAIRSGIHLTRRRAGAPTRRAPSLRSAWLILTGTVLACGALLIAADHERRLLIRTASAAGRVNTLSAPIAGLWNRFLDSDVPTLLVVSNPTVGECAEQKQGATGCPDEYTGMGEAVAIHLITSLFRSAKQTLIVKPSRIVNADDIQRYNLVLLGGKSVNIWTRRLGNDLSLDDSNPPQQYETIMDAKTGQVSTGPRDCCAAQTSRQRPVGLVPLGAAQPGHPRRG